MPTICARALGNNASGEVWLKSLYNCRRSCAQKDPLYITYKKKKTKGHNSVKNDRITKRR